MPYVSGGLVVFKFVDHNYSPIHLYESVCSNVCNITCSDVLELLGYLQLQSFVCIIRNYLIKDLHTCSDHSLTL